MKTAHKLALLAAIGLTAGSLIVYAQSDSSGPSGPPPGGQQGRPAPGVLLLGLLDKYDANHDGQLDQTEMAKLRSDIESGKIQPPRRGMGGPQGGNGQGMRQPPSAKELIKQFDTDNDGKLDEAELTALLKFMHEHRPPMHGPGGPGGADGPGGPPPGDAPQQQ